MLCKCMTQIRTCKDDKVTGYLGTVEEIDVRNQPVLLQDPFEIERIPAVDIIAVQHVLIEQFFREMSKDYSILYLNKV